jgi:hypothetical protein
MVEDSGADRPVTGQVTDGSTQTGRVRAVPDKAVPDEPVENGAVEQPAAGDDDTASDQDTRSRGYTPSKRERGLTTPKRPSTNLRRPGTTTTGRSRKGMTKEEKQELRELRRARRREVSEGMRRGDPRFLAARDQGPEKAIARDVVDSRRTVGTWFFGGALVILLGSSTAVPVVVTTANALFIMLTLAVTFDSVLICRKIKWLVRERHSDSTQRMGGLYLYAVMRSITFRRLRIPLPRKNFGDPV